MSRSFNERNKYSRTGKSPEGFLDKEGNVERHRKHRPYGLCGFAPYDGYSKNIGEYGLDIVKKKKARRDSKKQILNDLNDEI